MLRFEKSENHERAEHNPLQAGFLDGPYKPFGVGVQKLGLHGGNFIETVRFAVVPQVLPSFASYTLLRFGGSADLETLGEAFVARGAPYAVLDLPDTRARDVYGHDLILVRPDLHIVWRGNALPADADKLARVVTGH